MEVQARSCIVHIVRSKSLGSACTADRHGFSRLSADSNHHSYHRPRKQQTGAAANEHSPADDDNEVELLHKPVRLYGVNDKGGSTDQTPDECLRCDGQALRVEVGCACKGTGNDQQDAQCFIKPGQSLFFGQRVEQNHGWGGVGNITILVNPILFLNMGIVIFIGTVCAFCFYQAGVGIVGSIIGSILSSVEPVASMVLSVLFLHVPLTAMDFLGFLLTQ